MIRTPVRYEKDHHHIFEADGHSLCWLTRNTHHPEWHLKDEVGQEIADIINTAAADREKLEAAEAKLERIEKELQAIVTPRIILGTFESDIRELLDREFGGEKA